MTNETELPSVDRSSIVCWRLAHGPQHAVEGGLADSVGLAGRRRASPTAQNQALTVTSGAIDEARAAVDRATGALSETLRSDDPPTR